MYGSVFSAIQRPQNSVVHDGCLGEVTFEPSFRTILFGSAINKGIATPILVKARKPIWWWEKSGDRGLGLQHVYKRSWGGDVRRYHCQLRVVSMERRLSIWEMVASSGDNDFLTLVCLNISPIVMMWVMTNFQTSLRRDIETYRTMPIPTERDRCSNHTAQIENGPENANEFSLFLFSGIS